MWWDGINLTINQSKKSKNLPNNISDNNGNPINSNIDLAEEFARHFKNVPITTKNKVKTPEKNKNFKHYLNKVPVNENYLILDAASPLEVQKIILSLKSYSSPGPLKVPNAFIKLVSFQLSYPLANAINKSMEIGCFPNILKIGKQTPVFKSGKPYINNFRPITVCNVFSKILEKVVSTRLSNFIQENNILNKYHLDSVNVIQPYIQ